MNARAFLLPFAILPAFALAACGDAPDDAVSVQSNPDGSATMQVQVPESMAPAAEAIANPEETMQNIQQGAADMSEDAKVQAVQAARTTAEEAARLLGRTEAEIQQAGDDAERNTRQTLGMQ